MGDQNQNTVCSCARLACMKVYYHNTLLQEATFVFRDIQAM